MNDINRVAMFIFAFLCLVGILAPAPALAFFAFIGVMVSYSNCE